MVNTKIRAKLTDGTTRVRVLIQHPMHTGREKEAGTETVIPAHFIQRLKVERNGRLMIDCRLSTAVSRDPYLAFRLDGGAEGDRITVSWEDNRGQHDRQETIVRRHAGE